MLRDANFFGVFLGIESPRKASLAEAQKTQNEKLDLVKAVHKIQSYNLFVWAGMIVGFDQDDVDIFQEQFPIPERGATITIGWFRSSIRWAFREYYSTATRSLR